MTLFQLSVGSVCHNATTFGMVKQSNNFEEFVLILDIVKVSYSTSSLELIF